MPKAAAKTNVRDLDASALSKSKRPASKSARLNKDDEDELAGYTFGGGSSDDEQQPRTASPPPQNKSPPRGGGAAAAAAATTPPRSLMRELEVAAAGSASDTQEEEESDEEEQAPAKASSKTKSRSSRILSDDDDEDDEGAPVNASSDEEGAAAAPAHVQAAANDGYADDRHHHQAAPASPKKKATAAAAIHNDDEDDEVADGRPYLNRHNALQHRDLLGGGGGGYPPPPKASIYTDEELAALHTPKTPGGEYRPEVSYRWPSTPSRVPPAPAEGGPRAPAAAAAEHEALQKIVLKLAKNFNTFKTRAERALTDQARAYDLHIQEERRARRGLRDKQVTDEARSQELIRAVAKKVTDCSRDLRELTRRVDTLAAGEVYDAPPKRRSKSPAKRRSQSPPRRSSKKVVDAAPAPQPQGEEEEEEQDELARILDGPRAAAPPPPARPQRSTGMSTRNTKVTTGASFTPFLASPHDALHSLIVSAQRLQDPSHADLDIIAGRIPRVARISYTTSPCASP